MRAKLLIAFFILMLLVSYFQFLYDSTVNYFSEQDTFVILPSGKTLKILSFGYKNLLADLLFIWSIQFYSSYYLSNRYDYIEFIFNTITDLTPEYEEPYIVGAWIMALEKRDYRMAIRLLEKGSRNNPDEYFFDYEAGYYAYQNLKDYTLAEDFFKRAAERPNAPALLHRSRAHMVYMQDNLAYAWNLWMKIYQKASTQLEKDAAFNHLYQIKYEMDRKFLEAKLEQYKQRYHRYPTELLALKRVGLIRSIPRDFTDRDYLYNPKTGKVGAIKKYRWKKRS